MKRKITCIYRSPRTGACYRDVFQKHDSGIKEFCLDSPCPNEIGIETERGKQLLFQTQQEGSPEFREVIAAYIYTLEDELAQTGQAISELQEAVERLVQAQINDCEACPGFNLRKQYEEWVAQQDWNNPNAHLVCRNGIFQWEALDDHSES